jgi:hypothetical protein
MRNWWFPSVALALGVMAPVAYSADPAQAPPRRAPAAPAVTLGRPVAVGAVLDRQVQPTTFETPDQAGPVSRGAASDPIISRPLPVGPPPVNPNGVVPTWRKYGDPDTPPEPAPMPAKVASNPPVTDSGSFLSHIVPSLGGDTCDSCATGAACTPGCCGHCGSGGDRWYASAEYLLWWFKGEPVPPLVTSGSMGAAIPGALGMPGTSVLFGGRNEENGAHSGGRFYIGRWFGDECIAWEGGYFFLGPGVTNFVASSTGSPILARPIINAATGSETTELVAGPGVLAGTVAVQTRSSMWGAETNLRTHLWCGCRSTLDVLAGFRTLGLDEDLFVRENLTVLAAPGGAFSLVDHFRTENRFYGGQVGAEWQCHIRRWDLGIKTKLAIGATDQLVTISGNDVVTDPVNGTRSFNGGLLALPSNIGTYNRNKFTFVPEVGFTVGYNLTDHLRCFAGYNFLYWSSVARPGPQIDRTVNVNQIAPPIPGGPPRPAFSFNPTDFWAQGVNVGLEYKW